MDNEHGNDHSTSPHWKGDHHFFEDPKHPRSFGVPARALSITWGNDRRYWQWTSEDRVMGSEESIMLLQVNWIEITGKMDVSALKLKEAEKATCKIYYIMKFRVDAFGWHSAPVSFKVRLHGRETEHSVLLEPYRLRPDVWHEVSGGEITVSDTVTGNVEFGMFEVQTDWWKGGMIFGGIRIESGSCDAENACVGVFY